MLCDLTNPSRMYFQMRKNLPLINKMMDDIESFYANPRKDTKDLDIGHIRRDMIGRC